MSGPLVMLLRVVITFLSVSCITCNKERNESMSSFLFSSFWTLKIPTFIWQLMNGGRTDLVVHWCKPKWEQRPITCRQSPHPHRYNNKILLLHLLLFPDPFWMQHIPMHICWYCRIHRYILTFLSHTNKTAPVMLMYGNPGMRSQANRLLTWLGV